MDMTRKQAFMERWEKYFPGAEWPITFYYTNDAGRAEMVERPDGHRCFIAQLAAVRHGRPLCFGVDSVTCGGGRRYLGFSQALAPDFEYFLSHGIPGELEGERYKKSPELVREFLENSPPFTAPAEYIVFKRWDLLEADDEPEVVVFFATADVLAGLFTLANFDEPGLDAVRTPFAAGCGSIIQHAYCEKDKERPRAVIGLFDVSARPWMQKDLLSFAVPMAKFDRMIADMDESFLITPSWELVRKRIEGD